MDVLTFLTNLISNVGFPIAAFLLMWWQNQKSTAAITELSKTVEKNTEAIEDLREQIKEKKTAEQNK